MRRWRGVAFVALVGAACSTPSSAQDGRPAPPTTAPATTAAASVSPEAMTLEAVSVLIGCWAGTSGSIELRESWSDADGGVMLGTSRFFRDGALVDWEFGRLEASDEGITLWPYPSGRLSESGFPLASTGRELVFENLEHDFPVRIVYEVVGPDHLKPRIEGRDGNGPGWELRRTACPGAMP